MDQPRYQTPPPSTASPNIRIRHHRAKDLTRTQRIQCRTLRFDAKWAYSPIAKRLHFTKKQVRTACSGLTATPTKRTGRPLTLADSQIDEIISFISLSRANRRMTHIELAIGPFARFNVSDGVITYTLML